MEHPVFLIFGIVLFVIPFFPKVRLWSYRKRGEKCEGIIYRIEYHYNDEGGKTVERITVQFTTKSRQLVTSDLEISGGAFWAAFREGDKVPVVYDPSRPTHFTLTELPSDPLVSAACIIAGLFFIAFSA